MQTSAVATLKVWVPPSFTLQPASITNVSGMTVNFSASASVTPRRHINGNLMVDYQRGHGVELCGDERAVGYQTGAPNVAGERQ